MAEFLKNLDKSSSKIKTAFDFNNYWLSRNGTLKTKSHWLFRVVHFFQNLLYDKTIRDIVHVYERTLAQFLHLKQNLSPNIENPEVFLKNSEAYKRLNFVGQFLLSREERLDTYLTRHTLADLDRNLASIPKQGKLSGSSDFDELNFKTKMQFITAPILNLRGLSKRDPVPRIKEEDKVWDLELDEEAEEAAWNEQWNLLNYFDELMPEIKKWDTEVYKRANEMRANLSAMLDALKENERTQVYGPKIPVKEIQTYFAKIAYLFSCKHVPKEYKFRALYDLCKASSECPPTWHETAINCFTMLNEGDETFENKILRYVAEIKESQINTWYNTHFKNDSVFQNQWHYLSWIRERLGQKWGIYHERAKNDPYRTRVFNKKVPLTPQSCEAILRTEITADLLIKGVKRSFNDVFKPNEKDFMAFCGWLQKEMNARGYTDELLIAPFADKNKRQITTAGTTFMLRALGIIS